jgi:hypothetical protein
LECDHSAALKKHRYTGKKNNPATTNTSQGSFFRRVRPHPEGNNVKSVVCSLVYKHVPPLLVSDGRLRTFAKKLRLKITKLSRALASLCTVRIDAWQMTSPRRFVCAIREN